MNKQEYGQTAGKQTNAFYKRVHEELEKWKIKNNITECCDVHHRDDTDEVKEYNELHYERWGCEEDGTFIEGKYVQFLTHSEHAHHHHVGEKNHMYGKTGEKNPMYGVHRFGDKAPRYGKQNTEESKQKISATCKANMKIVGGLWRLYKQLHPESKMTYHEFRHSLKTK